MDFKCYVRMDIDHFEELVHLFKPISTKARYQHERMYKLIRVDFLHQAAFASAARFHYPPSCCKMLEFFGLFWVFSEFDRIKAKMFQQIYWRSWDMQVFSCFLTCNIRFLLPKWKKNSNWFEFLFCFSNKTFSEKSCKTKKFNMGTRWSIYWRLQHISYFVTIT